MKDKFWPYESLFFKITHKDVGYHRTQWWTHGNTIHLVVLFTSKKKLPHILLPCLGLQSNHVAKRLKSFVYKLFSSVNQKIFQFQNTRCRKSLFSHKDHFIVHNNPRLFTELIAGDCNSFCIGKTKRRLPDSIARNSEPKWAVFIFVTRQHTCQPVNKASVWLVYVLKGKRSGKPVVKPFICHWAVGIKMAIVFTEHLMRRREAIKTVYSTRSK